MGEGIGMRGWNLIEGRETREKIVRIECSLGGKSISIRKCYSILFYHFKKPFYYLYHTILQYLQHPKTLFLLKYYFFNLFLLFLSNRHFFFKLWHVSIFLSFPTLFFFLSLPQPLALIQHTEPHTHTQTQTQTIKPSTKPHTQTQTQTIKPSTKPHTQTQTIKPSTEPVRANNHQTSWSQQRPPHLPPKPPISKLKPPIRNPRRQFETHQSKPIKKNHHRSHHGATND